jgi:hypothetical protein
MSDTLLSPKTIAERYFTAPQNQLINMLRSGLRRRGRATSQHALACHRGITACTRYRAAVVRALVQTLYKHLGAIFFGGRGGSTRARATETLFQLLLPPLFASCLVDYLEIEIQNTSTMTTCFVEGKLCVVCRSTGGREG